MNVVSDERQQQILDLLNEIEEKNNITIIYAVESGSRAWGFPSQDSDYDIRFIYHHSPNWYLSAFDKVDCIELAIDDELDAGGWDVGKSMRLLNKGNAVIHEWLNSPVVYLDDAKKAPLLKHLAQKVFNPASAFYHYRSLAKKKFSDPKTQTNAKYFLYGLRALLCAIWIRDHFTAPPVRISALVDRYLADELKDELELLLTLKSKGGEGDEQVIHESLWQYGSNLLVALNDEVVEGRRVSNLDVYDNALREILGVT